MSNGSFAQAADVAALIARWQREADNFRTVAAEMFEHGDNEEGTLCDVEASRLDTCASELRALAPPHPPADQPDAWEWRACIGGKCGAWLYLDQPIEKFCERNAFNIENGTFEYRPLYAHPPAGNAAVEALAQFYDGELASATAQLFDALNEIKRLRALQAREAESGTRETVIEECAK